MIPSWYDVLGVDADATTDEIRAAWQESVAGLDPTDRRFKQRNRAAEVLLDDERRAAHDADLAAQEADESDESDEADEPVATASTVSLGKGAPTPEASVDAEESAGPDRPKAPRTSQVALTLALGVVALLLLLATIVALVAGGRSDTPAQADDTSGLPDAREVAAARAAAETAIGPVLSYDYRDLDKSKAAATSFMTDSYAEEYDKQFVVIQDNAPKSQTIVTAEVVDSGIVRTGEDRVDVLVFVNRPTRNVSKDEVSRDQVTVRMLDVGGSWLVDCLITAPGGTCGS